MLTLPQRQNNGNLGTDDLREMDSTKVGRGHYHHVFDGWFGLGPNVAADRQDRLTPMLRSL